MSHYDYEMSRTISKDDPPFASLIMAAMRKADTQNMYFLQLRWPEIWKELDLRYHARGGYLPGE